MHYCTLLCNTTNTPLPDLLYITYLTTYKQYCATYFPHNPLYLLNNKMLTTSCKGQAPPPLSLPHKDKGQMAGVRIAFSGSFFSGKDVH